MTTEQDAERRVLCHAMEVASGAGWLDDVDPLSIRLRAQELLPDGWVCISYWKTTLKGETAQWHFLIRPTAEAPAWCRP